MKFQDPKTGKVFDGIEKAHSMYCIGKDCYTNCKLHQENRYCVDFCNEYSAEAARLMGYEVIDDSSSEIDEKQTDSTTTLDETQTDPVNHPAHYTQGGIECIDALKAATVGLEGIQAVCVANAIKYIWRFKDKNGVRDLDKAIWYINRLKEEIGNG